MDKKFREQVSSKIGEIGYTILEEYVGPAVGVSGIVADLYLADIGTYLFLESEEAGLDTELNILQKVFEHYGIVCDRSALDYFCGWSIAQLALYIIENGTK